MFRRLYRIRSIKMQNCCKRIYQCQCTVENTSLSCADEAVIFNNGRVSLQRLQHAADTHATGKVDVFTNLRTGTDGRPGINHGAFINICADVDVSIGKTFSLADCSFCCSAEDFRRMVVIYQGVIDFTNQIYHQYIEGRPVDFEISIDETETPTTPLQHFFVANELLKRGVRFATIAPRFCGEFQKGIDYIGDCAQFAEELKQHVAIANALGYKLSIHSGSDKFAVFPTIGQLTGGHFHLKTAGTNWLVAMELVARKDPALYREIHAFALKAFQSARQYYHVSTELADVPSIDTLPDDQLSSLFRQNAVRQLIHITYGQILTEKAPSGASLFKERLYALWRKYDT